MKPALWRSGASALILGGSLLVAGAVLDARALAPAYLGGLLFVGGMPIGLLAIRLVHELTGGRWGEPVTLVSASCARLAWLLPALASPMLLGLGAGAWRGAAEPHVLLHREAWMNPPAILARTGLSLALWAWMAGWLRAAGPPGAVSPGRTAAAGLFAVVLVVSVTAVSYDWVMALQPALSSSMFGLTVLMSCVGNALALVTLAGAAGVVRVNERVLRDLGALLLAGVLLDFYVSFSQFLVVWNGNLPNEVSWYAPRMNGPWCWLTAAMALLRYGVPIPLLITGGVKRSSRASGAVAAIVLAGGALQAMWLVAPSGVGGRQAALIAGTAGAQLALAGAALLACAPALSQSVPWRAPRP